MFEPSVKVPLPQTSEEFDAEMTAFAKELEQAAMQPVQQVAQTQPSSVNPGVPSATAETAMPAAAQPQPSRPDTPRHGWRIVESPEPQSESDTE